MTHTTLFNVLVFSKTSGYRHDSIPAGISAIQGIAANTKSFKVDATEDADVAFTSSSLGQYKVVVLLQCTGDFFIEAQLEALKTHVRTGGGIVAIHGAAAGMLDDEWYGKLIGAHFDSHPNPEPGRVIVEHGAESGSEERDGRDGWKDEWYNFRTHPRSNKNLKILLRGDPTSFSGGKMGDDHPLSWYQEFDGGRSFYTALGHFDEAYTDDWFVEQISRGIFWAAKHVNVLEIPSYKDK